jgi:hypothetical protein
MQNLLEDWASSSFDANITICKALLAQIKTSPQDEEYLRHRGPIGGLISTFWYHAQTLAPDEHGRARRVALLDALESTLEHFRVARDGPNEPVVLARRAVVAL